MIIMWILLGIMGLFTFCLFCAVGFLQNKVTALENQLKIFFSLYKLDIVHPINPSKEAQA